MTIQPHDVVQIDPDASKPFSGCFVVVLKVTDDAIVGYIQVPLNLKQRPATTTVKFPREQVRLIGAAGWVRDDVKIPEPQTTFGAK